MKRILIVGGHSSNNTDAEELQAFSTGVDYSVHQAMCEAATVDTLSFVIEPGRFDVYTGDGTSLKHYDLVILRNKMRTYSNVAYLLSRYCTVHGLKFFNDYSDYFPATKAAQAVVFYEQSVPFIKTVYAMSQEVLTSIIQQELNFPCILKDSKGAKGASNYLVENIDQLQALFLKEPRTDFIAQTYIPNDCDYRILLLGDQTLVIKRQGSAGSHLNNTSTGGQAQLVALIDFPENVIAMSRDLAQAMNLTIAGIDVVPHKDTGEFYVLETNAQPQIFTGSFLAEKQQAMSAFLAEF